VNLLIALLQFHEIKTWSSGNDLAAGSRFREQLDSALHDAESVIVVVSKHSALSKWVTKELSAFQEKKPNAPIIPLLLDGTGPDDVIDRLTDYEALDFTDDMLDGCKRLLDVYGKNFLPRLERRNEASRRAGTERRGAGDDRRRSLIIQRMRIGFWKAYTDALGIGKFDLLRMGVTERFKAIEAITDEAERYVYTRRDGKEMPGQQALEEAANHVWQEYRSKDFVKAVYVIEAVAEQMHATYTVCRMQRRRATSRRTNAGRRKR